jgi:hypothetical protein
MKETEISIVQSNDLVRARPKLDQNDYQLSLVQKRILYYVIDLVRKSNTHPIGTNWVRVHINKLIQTITPYEGGYNSGVIWAELDKFRDQKYHITITYRKDGELRQRDTQWILEIDKPVTASGYLDLHIPSLIVQQVKDLDDFFTMIDMDTALKAKSQQQLKFYELLLSYLSLGHWKTSIKQLKHLLEIKEDSYQKFSHFKKHMLDRCCIFINQKTRLNVEYEVVREGRKPVDLLFKIKEKPTTWNNLDKPLKSETTKTLQKEKVNKVIDMSSSMEKKLEHIGVVKPSQFEIPDLIWQKAIVKEKGNPPSHVITTAKSLLKQSQQTKIEEDKQASEHDIIKTNKTWFDFLRFESSKVIGTTNDAYVIVNGSAVKFIQDDFQTVLKPFILKDDD